MEICRICKGNCDSGELVGGICPECQEEERRDQERNRMSVYPEPHISPEITERLNGPGYKQLGTGVFVPEEDAFAYALEQCAETVPDGFFGIRWTEEFKEMLVEWFYSGNWIKEN